MLNRINLNVSVYISAALFLVQTGCATAPQKPFGPTEPTYLNEQDRGRIGTVGIVAARFVPEIDVESLKPSAGFGAAKGAVTGAVVGATGATLLAQLLICAGFPFSCSAILQTAAEQGLAQGALVGGLHGTLNERRGVTEAEIKTAVDAVNSAIQELKVQQQLLGRVTGYAHDEMTTSFVPLPEIGPASLDVLPDYGSIADRHIDSVLETSVVKLATSSIEKITPGFALKMTARARLIRLADHAILSDQTFQFYSETRPFAEWAGQDAKEFRGALKRGYRELAEQIIDEFFLLYTPPSNETIAKTPEKKKEGNILTAPEPRALKAGKYMFPSYTLRPEHPVWEKCGGWCGPLNYGAFKFAEVNSLTPEFRWERFPRPTDLAFSEYKFSNVSYEFRIYKAHRFLRHTFIEVVPIYPIIIPIWMTVDIWNASELVYSRESLLEPMHALESSLEPCTNYLWTVRARYELDGNIRVTEWAGTYPSDRTPWMIRHHFDIPQKEAMGFIVSQDGYYIPFHTSSGTTSTPCEGKPMEQSVEIENKMMGAPSPSREMQKPTSGQSSSGSSFPVQSVTKPSTQEVISSPSIDGAFLGKEIKTTGLAGLVRGIDIKLLLSNKAKKDIAKVSGKVKLSDDSGNEIGSVSFHAEKRIPSYGNIEITQTVYPIVFFGYTKLKEASQEKIKAEFTFESIEFSDGSKAKN